MRLAALDLVRYGKFTDLRLDFGPAVPGRPDLHLIYGPNEAGKSTLFSAVLDLFFGIESRSPYGFLHPYPVMRIGATVETGGRSLAVSRVKRNQNSLLGPDDQPLPDSLFASAFGSVDRAAYQLMFSLDDDSIEKGGESILRSEGELGTLLFSASSGLPDISAVIADLKARTDGFYRPQARKHRLAELKAELETLKAARAAADLSQREFTTLRKARDVAAERHEAAFAERAGLRVALDGLKAKLDGLPLLLRLRALRGELAAFGDTADPPAVWSQILPDLMREETELATRLAQVEADIERRVAERDGIGCDLPARGLGPDLRDLESADLEARHRTAARDMPARRDERARTVADLAARLAQLGRPPGEEARALLLPAATVGKLRAMAEMQARLVERLEAARRERASAEAAHRAALQAAEMPRAVHAVDLAALSDLVRALRRDDFPLRQKAARDEIARLEDALADQMAALGGRRDADGLASLPVPAEGDLATWSYTTETLAERARRLAERLAETELQIATVRAQRDSLTLAADFADDDAAAALRRSRDAAWRQHRDALSAETADRFETILSEDDRAGAARLAQTERLAQSRALALTLAEAEAKRAALLAQREAVAAERVALAEIVAGACAACRLAPETSLAALEDWLSRRARALDVRAGLRAARQTLAQADADEASAMARLSALVEVPEDFEMALAAAERILATLQGEAVERRAAAEGVTRTENALRSRAADADAAVAAMDVWTADWQDRIAGTWLAGEDGAAGPAEAMAVLTVLSDIERLTERQGDLDHRIEAMTRDQTAFAAAVHALADRLGMQADADPLATFMAVRTRMAAAARDDALSARLSGEIDGRRREAQDIAEQQDRHDARKQDMLDHFGCSDLSEVATRLETARARTRLCERIAETEADLAARLRVARAEEAEMILSALDEDGLRREAAEIEARHDEADRAVQERHAELREAVHGLEKAAGEDAAAYIDERHRTVLAQIEEEAITYLRLRSGILACDMALRLYRERHRSAMMQRASAAFATISGGEYEGLSTEMEKGGEFLLVRSAAGPTKLAKDLSKGTRFQLYLALRMAGFHEIGAQREALPFIADDIMETFDDNRAFHAFRLMGEMATVGQVIYLTHHEHLCEIARKACPDVAIHRL